MRSRTPGGRERRRKATAAAAWLRRRSITDLCREQSSRARRRSSRSSRRERPPAAACSCALLRPDPMTGVRSRNLSKGRSRRRASERWRILAVEADVSRPNCRRGDRGCSKLPRFETFQPRFAAVICVVAGPLLDYTARRQATRVAEETNEPGGAKNRKNGQDRRGLPPKRRRAVHERAATGVLSAQADQLEERDPSRSPGHPGRAADREREPPGPRRSRLLRDRPRDRAQGARPPAQAHRQDQCRDRAHRRRHLRLLRGYRRADLAAPPRSSPDRDDVDRGAGVAREKRAGPSRRLRPEAPLEEATAMNSVEFLAFVGAPLML